MNEAAGVRTRRRLEDVIEDTMVEDAYVYGLDRVERLDHDADSVRRALEALEETLQCLRENNEIDPDDKTRIELELHSGVQMIKAPKTRIKAAGVVLFGALKWLVDRFASSTVGVAAAKALAAARIALGL